MLGGGACPVNKSLGSVRGQTKITAEFFCGVHIYIYDQTILLLFLTYTSIWVYVSLP